MIRVNLTQSLPITSSKKIIFKRNAKKSLDEIRQLAKEFNKYDFNEKLWRELKKILWEGQGKKCCYCERRIPSLGEGDVDHYRPKRDAKDIENKEILLKNGYWWLAYEWKNFLFVCRTCNNQKLNRFPLTQEKDRVTQNCEWKLNRKGRLLPELPILINPRFEDDDPEEFFIYDFKKAHSLNRVYIAPCGHDQDKSSRAATTIQIADLNRTYRVNRNGLKDTLLEDRAHVYADLQQDLKRLVEFEVILAKANENYAMHHGDATLRGAISGLKKSIKEQKAKISSYTSHNAQFAGMCRCYLKGQQDLEELIEN